MKKLFTLLLFLVGGVIIVQAQKLRVGGKTIDLSTTATYSGGNITSGSVTYNHSTKRLTLKNAVITGSDALSGEKLGSLMILLDGDCQITPATNDYIRFDDTDVLIQGFDNKLTIDHSANTNTGYCAFDIEGGYLQIWNTIIDFNGGAGTGIYGRASTGKLQMIRVYGTIQGKAGAVEGFKTADISDDCMLFTTGATFKSGTGIVGSNQSLLEQVSVRPFLMVGRLMVRTGNNTDTEGKASWTKSTKTLTLSGDFTATEGYPAIANYGIDGLIIKTEEARTIRSLSTNCIEAYKATQFTGSGKFTIEASSNTGIYPMKAEAALTFDGCNLEISGRYGIDGYGSSEDQANITFKNATLKVTGTKSAMGRLAGATFEGCDVSSPANVYFKNHGFREEGSSDYYAGTIEIKKATTTYPVAVLGKRINDVNASHFHVDGLTAGTITYNSTGKKLTLNAVTLTNPESYTGFGIETIEGIEIEAIGTNSITSAGTGLALEGDTKISGSTLNVTSTNNSGIGMWSGDKLTVKCNKLYSKGKYRGYWANGKGKLNIERNGTNYSDYTFVGEDYTAITATADLTFGDKQMDFYSNTSSGGTPGCYFDAEKMAVMQNGDMEPKKVNFYVIENKYDFSVGGVPVTNCNSAGIGSKYITAGGPEAVTYNASSKTLTLNNATIDTNGNAYQGIENAYPGVSGMYINVVGTNKIVLNTSNYGLYLGTTTTVKGSGSLEVGNGLNFGNNSVITFDNVNVKYLKGLSAKDEDHATLVVNLTTAGKKVEVGGYVSGWADVTLRNGTKITKPEGGYYDNTKKYVVTASGTDADGVIFADKNATGINSIEMDANAEVIGIYDHQGRQLQEMQPGVNIVRMSDGTTRKVIRK